MGTIKLWGERERHGRDNIKRNNLKRDNLKRKLKILSHDKTLCLVETAKASGGREAGLKSLEPSASWQPPSRHYVQKNFPLDASNSRPCHLICFPAKREVGTFPLPSVLQGKAKWGCHIVTSLTARQKSESPWTSVFWLVGGLSREAPEGRGRE